jgi:WD40 repeat protein
MALGKEIHTLEERTGKVGTLKWSPDGARLAWGAKDGVVRLWEAAAAKTAVTLKGHGAAVVSVAWSPDGTRLVSGSFDGTIRVWEVNAGKEIFTCQGIAAAWSPDGTRLACGAEDTPTSLRIHDARRGYEVAPGRNSPVDNDLSRFNSI